MNNNLEYSLWAKLKKGEISLNEYNFLLKQAKKTEAKSNASYDGRTVFKDANKANSKGYSKVAMFRK